MPRVIILAFLFSLLTPACFAQDYFAFITSADKQPFYVRVDSQYYGSTPEGHLILSRLKDTTYKLTVGIPGQTAAEQHYVFSIRGRDQEFELRRQDNQGWKVYDVQAKGWLAEEPGTGSQEELKALGIKKDDAFSRMMAGVVRDTAVLYNNFALEQTLSDTPATATHTDSVHADTAAASATATNPAQIPATSGAPNPATTQTPPATTLTRPPATTARVDTPATANPGGAASLAAASPDTMARVDSATTIKAPDPRVVKVSERRTPRNLRQVYTVQQNYRKADTVVILIPLDTPASRPVPVSHATGMKHTAESTHPKTDSGRLSASHPKTDSNRLVATHIDTPATATRQGSQPNPLPHDTAAKHPPKTIPYINSDCHDLATDYDADKLRSKLLEAFKDEDRLTIARKAFKVKCYSTKQLRDLVPVFATDAARFRFLEVAWPFAADEHFHELSDLLTDPVYLGEFKTMIHQQ